MFSKINESIESQLNKYLKLLETWLNTWQFKMAPEKCSYTIFSRYYKAGDKGKKGIQRESFDLFLYDAKIPNQNSPLFLGLRFDKYFCFKDQINYLKETCNDRLNIIKVLSHYSWKINTKTLTQLYKSLLQALFSQLSQSLI